MPEAAHKAFLGSGWAHPIRTDDNGRIGLSVYEEDIRQSIRLILGTAPGERVMRPDFGAGLRALVFEPLNTTTIALARQRVEDALILWEPRIEVAEVHVTGDTSQTDRPKLEIRIEYRVRATNTFYNLVYPFYLVEGERE